MKTNRYSAMAFTSMLVASLASIGGALAQTYPMKPVHVLVGFHVAYRGSPQAVTDLLSGQVQLAFEPLPPSIEFIKLGKLRALAVTTATRSEALPNVPAGSEFVPGYEASGWNGVCAPKNTRTEIIKSSTRRSMRVLPIPS